VKPISLHRYWRGRLFIAAEAVFGLLILAAIISLDVYGHRGLAAVVFIACLLGIVSSIWWGDALDRFEVVNPEI
jgi:hypothetical protein